MHLVTFASRLHKNNEASVSGFLCQYSDTPGRVPSKIGELWQRVWELDWEGGGHEDEMP